MVNFTTHSTVIELMTDAQTVEKDNRDRSLEANKFLDDRDGQWEQDVIVDDDAPRYTFDVTGPVVDQIAGDIEQADFGIRIKPAGGNATKDDALLFDGLVRNIENISGAKYIFSTAGRAMVTGGISGWRVEQKFIDGDSFDQDLVITAIDDFTNRVWFDPNAKERNKSDAKYCFVANPLSKEQAEEMFPGRAIVSVQSTTANVENGFAPDDVFIGQIYWKKPQTRELVLMSDGAVYDAESDEFKSVKDDLAEKEITEVRRRKRTVDVVMSRLFDASDWLIEPEETVFRHLIPVVPCYGNYKIINNKTKYRGAVEKLMDPQRVLNYSLSREIAEGALAPRAKIWLTAEQAAGHEDTLATLNVNHDPVQFYNADPNLPGPPPQTGGALINAGLRVISETMQTIVNKIGGMFNASMGDNPNAQSGVAIAKLQAKGDTGSVHYFTALEIAIAHTGCILVDAIPRVYDTERQVRILKEDGTFDMVFLNQVQFDDETQKQVTLNDLSKGKYDVTCQAGPSFQNRQQEAVTGIIEAAALSPEVMLMGDDIVVKNMTWPGAEQLADRLRARKFDQGLIPVDQMTDEEKEQLIAEMKRAQQSEGEATPEQMIGQAELIKAQNEQAKTSISVQEKSANIALAQKREQLNQFKVMSGAQNDRSKLEQSAQDQQFSQMIEVQEQQRLQTQVIFDTVAAMAGTLKTLNEAAAGPIVGPGIIDNVATQSNIVSDAQAQI